MSALAKIRKAWQNYRRPWHGRREPAWFRDGLEGKQPRVDGEPEPPPKTAEYEAETDEQP
jgi:hypothetical protein